MQTSFWCLIKSRLSPGVLITLILSFWLTACAGTAQSQLEIGAKILAANATVDAASPVSVVQFATPTPTSAPDSTDTPEAEPAIEIDTRFSLFVDADGRFELELPSDWDINADNGSVFAYSQDDRASLSVLALPGNAILDDTALEAYGESFLATFFDGEDVSLNESSLQGDGSYGFDFSIPSDSAPLEGLLFVEQRGIDLFHLVVLADADAWSAYNDAVFGPVINSYYVTTANTEEYLSEPLALASYADSDGFFRIDLPEDWLLDTAEGTVASIAPDNLSAVYVTSLDVDFDIADIGAEAYSQAFLEEFYENSTAIIDGVEAYEDNAYDVTFTIEDEDNTIYGFMEVTQYDNYLYLLIFQADQRDWFGLIDTYSNIVASYAATPPTAASPTPEPEPTSTPARQANPFAPLQDRARLYVFNEIGEELTFTINDQEFKIPPGGIDNPVPIDLDAGRYTFTVSIPFAAVNSEVTLGVNESWAVGVRSDKAVYDPFQVYP